MSEYVVFLVKKDSELNKEDGTDEKFAAKIFSVCHGYDSNEYLYVSALSGSEEHSFLTLQGAKPCGSITIDAHKKEVWEKRYKNIEEKAQAVFGAYPKYFSDYFDEIKAYGEAVAHQSHLGEFSFSDCSDVPRYLEDLYEQMRIFGEIYIAINEEFEICLN